MPSGTINGSAIVTVSLLADSVTVTLLMVSALSDDTVKSFISASSSVTSA